jgi:hypothetical protein
MRFRENDHINNTYLQVLKEQRTLKEDLGDPHDVDLSRTPKLNYGSLSPADFNKFKELVIASLENGDPAQTDRAISRINNSKHVSDMAQKLAGLYEVEVTDMLIHFITAASGLKLTGYRGG